jgi:PTH1 family peptidyl-tRNA hydrolase
MQVILGIGNPGAQYERTRHNAGFLALDELARRHGLNSWQRRWDAEVCEWRLPESSGGGRVLLVKPQTFVNHSGQSAQAVLAFHKVAPAALLVVVDDLNLPLGTLRLRPSGSAGGHNGLRDIEARIGQDYPRLRLGIGRPPHDQIEHVLGAFAPQEQEDLARMVHRAVDCIEGWITDGVAVACRFNGPSAAPAAAPLPPSSAPPPPRT